MGDRPGLRHPRPTRPGHPSPGGSPGGGCRWPPCWWGWPAERPGSPSPSYCAAFNTSRSATPPAASWTGGIWPRLAPNPRAHHGGPPRGPRLVVAAPTVHRRGRVGYQGAPRTGIAAAGARHHGRRGSTNHCGRCRRVAGPGGGAPTAPPLADSLPVGFGCLRRSAGRCWPACSRARSSTDGADRRRAVHLGDGSPPSPGGTSFGGRHLGHRNRAGVAGPVHPSELDQVSGLHLTGGVVGVGGPGRTDVRAARGRLPAADHVLLARTHAPSGGRAAVSIVLTFTALGIVAVLLPYCWATARGRPRWR